MLADLTALEARLAVLPGTVLSRCVGAIEGHLDQAAARLADLEAGGVPDDIGYARETLTADRRRMRFFLGLIIEADQDPALRTMVDGHIAQFDAMVALYYGRARGDADVEAFLSALRGFGMRQLLRDGPPVAIDVPALARRFGLRR